MSRHLIMAAVAGGLSAIAACATDSDIDDLVFDESALEASALDESAVDEFAAIGATEAPDEAAALGAFAGPFDLAEASELYAPDDKKADVWFEDLRLQLKATGKIEKLDDKKGVVIKLEAEARAVAKCTNPGGNDPPGQNPVYIEKIEVRGQKTFPAKDIKHGVLWFWVITDKPYKLVVDGAPDCPNENWKETITDLKFRKCTLTIKQEGKKDFVVKCTFSKPTEDGPVPKKDVHCTTY